MLPYSTKYASRKERCNKSVNSVIIIRFDSFFYKYEFFLILNSIFIKILASLIFTVSRRGLSVQNA